MTNDLRTRLAARIEGKPFELAQVARLINSTLPELRAFLAGGELPSYLARRLAALLAEPVE